MNEIKDTFNNMIGCYFKFYSEFEGKDGNEVKREIDRVVEILIAIMHLCKVNINCIIYNNDCDCDCNCNAEESV